MRTGPVGAIALTHIIFIEHDGTSRTVDVTDGLSVMEGALRHHIPGIEGDCGGACACATCRVDIAGAWAAQLTPPNPLEIAMLKMAVEPNASSRLCCQIKVTPALEGLTVVTPKSQY